MRNCTVLPSRSSSALEEPVAFPTKSSMVETAGAWSVCVPRRGFRCVVGTSRAHPSRRSASSPRCRLHAFTHCVTLACCRATRHAAHSSYPMLQPIRLQPSRPRRLATNSPCSTNWARTTTSRLRASDGLGFLRTARLRRRRRNLSSLRGSDAMGRSRDQPPGHHAVALRARPLGIPDGPTGARAADRQ